MKETLERVKMGSFGALDIFLILVLLIFAIRGANRGFIKEVFSIFALILGFFLGIKYSGKLSAYFDFKNDSNVMVLILSFLIILVTVFLIAKLIEFIVKGVLNALNLKDLDKILGFVIGLFEGLLLIYALFMLLDLQPFVKLHSFLDKSFIYNLISPSFKERFTELYKNVQIL